MYLSYKTLEELIEKPKRVSPRELAELLTMSVMEVESVKSEAERLEKVVVGAVIEVSNHPNADKLKLAKVDIGGKKVEIVCGGVNLAEGMKVAMALPGALVRWHGEGEFAPLESAIIRGVKSNGMACAAAELGLSDDNEPEHGIMDLSNLKSKPGTPLAEAFGKDDLVLEVDNKSITHRPDLWGHLGVARELAALWGTELKIPQLAEIESGSRGLKVEIKNSSLCPRYMGVILDGIKVGPSPNWLKNKVEALGMRSINNVVDAANYVMLEIGQPLHTFDLKKLSSPKIIVRQAKSGETIKTLDGILRKLSTDMLVIADDKGPIALAGVMGGEYSEVSVNTTSLVVESATFDAINIRQTAMKLGLRSEASARFEKALDPDLAEIAIKRFVVVMQQIDKGVKVDSDLIDAYPRKLKPVVIDVSPDWINARLGIQIKIIEIKSILENLGFNVIARSGAAKQSHGIAASRSSGTRNDSMEWQITVPTWRAGRDVTIKEDLLEEVARIYGYGKIIATLPSFPITQPEVDESQRLIQKVRDVLVGAGFAETLSYSFLGQKDLEFFGSEYKSRHITTELSIQLENPTDQGKPFLRPTLLPNFLKQAGVNSQKHKEVKMFEVGRVFVAEDGVYARGPQGGKLPKQPYHLAIVLGKIHQEKLNCYREVVGTVELLGKSLGTIFEFVKPNHPDHDWYEKDMASDIMLEGKLVGHIGVLPDNLASKLDLPNVAVVVELSLDALSAGEANEVKSIPEFQEGIRDLSIIIPVGVTWAQIQKEIENVDLLESIEPFDVYAPKRSIAFTVTFRSPDRTLTSEEVEEQVEKIKQTLTKKFKVEVRDH